MLNSVKPLLTQSPTITLDTGTSYTWRILRNDKTVLQITAQPTSATSSATVIPLASAPGGVLGGNGANSNNKVAIKPAAQPWDRFKVNSRWGNRADSSYFFGKGTARGIRNLAGELDIENKQANFEKTYIEDCMISMDAETQRTIVAADCLGQHANWAKAAVGAPFPLPPFNNPAGPYRLAFTSGGNYPTARGDTITGATSGATGLVGGVEVSSGSFAAETAAGYIYLESTTGVFVSENLNVGVNLNVATIAGAVDHFWPNVTGAATFQEPLTGDPNVTLGTQPDGLVDRDDLGPICDWVWPWTFLNMNISSYRSSRSGSLNQFGAATDPSLPHNIAPVPTYHWINNLGELILADVSTSAGQSPMPDSFQTEVKTDALAGATKLYVNSVVDFAAGMRTHVEISPHISGFDQVYAGVIQTVASDSGGFYITIPANSNPAITARSQVTAFEAGGSPPSYFVRPDNYLVS